MAADIVVVGMVVEDIADHKVVDIVVEPVVVDMVGHMEGMVVEDNHMDFDIVGMVVGKVDHKVVDIVGSHMDCSHLF